MACSGLIKGLANSHRTHRNIDRTLFTNPLNDEKTFWINLLPDRGAGPGLGLGSGCGSGSGLGSGLESVGSEMGLGTGSDTGTTVGPGVGVTVGASPFQITSVCLIWLWLAIIRSAVPFPVVSTANVERPVFES